MVAKIFSQSCLGGRGSVYVVRPAPQPRLRWGLVIADCSYAATRPGWASPFLQEAHLSEMTGHARPGARPSFPPRRIGLTSQGPSVSELAGRIKGLKGANTIEAMPQRTQRKHAAAEEPITARIRRRQEEAGQHDERPAEAAAATPEPNSSAKPTTFQERILRERNGQTDGHTPE